MGGRDFPSGEKRDGPEEKLLSCPLWMLKEDTMLNLTAILGL